MASSMELSRFVDVLNHGRGSFALLAQFFVILNFMSEPLRWRLYTRVSHDVSYRRYFDIFSFTALSSYMLPFKLGIPFRIFLLREKASLDIKYIASLMTLDGFLYYSAWMMAAGAAILYGVGKIGFSGNIVYIVGVVLVVIVFAGLGFVLLHDRNVLKTRFGFVYEKLGEALGVLKRIDLRQYASSSIVILIDILAQILRHYFILKMIGVDIALPDVAAMTSLSVFAGMASMMPMGLVGYDATIILLLQKAGVPVELALLVPLVNRLFSVLTSVVLGIWGASSLGYTPINGVRKIRNAITRK